MNARNYQTITELLKTVNASLVTYALIVTMLFTIGISQYVLLSMLLLFIPVISRYLEHHAKDMITFLLCHIILGLVLFLLPQDLVVKIIYVMYIVIIMIYHLYRRIKSKSMDQGNTFYLYLFLLIIMQIYANWREYSQLSRIIQMISLLFIILYFVNVYLSNFTYFFASEAVDINVNIQQIKRCNHTLVFVFMSFISFIMIGTFSIPSNKILSILKSIVIYLLRLFFSLFKESPHVEEVAPPEERAPILEGLVPSETTETNPIWLLIQDILLKACFVIIILVIVSLIIYGVYQLYKHFHTAKRDKTEKKEFISPFFKESKVKNIRMIQKAKLHLFLSNSEKIRRYFYQEIKKKYKDKVPNNLTADELLKLPVQSISLLLSEDPDKLNPQILILYHKARYSNGLCSKEEVNQMKGMIKGNK